MRSSLGGGRARLALAAASLPLLFACGSDDAEPRVLWSDLLERGPDEVLSHPGFVVPDTKEQWSTAGVYGWWRETFTHEDGTPFVRASQPAVGLALRANRPEAREVELTVWSEGAPGEVSASVLLNGDVLGEVTLGTTPDTVALQAPEARWTLGANLLEIELTEGAFKAGARIALARVDYGEPRAVALASAARLEPSTGLRYRVAPDTAGVLRAAGTAEGPGDAFVSVRILEAADATLASTLPPQRISPEDGALEIEIPLPAVSDQLVELDLLWGGRDGALVLDTIEVQAAEPDPRPPVIFISIDTLAARHMSVYDYARDTTPNMKALCESAVVFERCVSNAPWTLPSYLSVMSGYYPTSLRYSDQDVQPGAPGWEHWGLAESRLTLAEMLRARGYRTGAFVDTLWLSDKFRFDQGFEVLDTRPGKVTLGIPLSGIASVNRLALEWLDTLAGDAPFFLFCHALDAHAPYLPQPPWKGTYAEDVTPGGRTDLAGSVVGTYGSITFTVARSVTETDDIPGEMEVEPIIAAYDSAILRVDAALGELFDALRERDLFERSIIVISADHGESFDNGFYSHGALWEDVIRVPLIVRLPNGAHGGRRVTESVQLVDLYPTLAELTGGMSRDDLHGRSLAGVLRGDELPSATTFSEGGHVEQYMIEEGGWKLVEVYPARGAEPSLLTHPRTPTAWLDENFPELTDRALTFDLWQELRERPGYAQKMEALGALIAGPYYSLYDLREDPLELHDLASERPEVVERLRPKLESLREDAVAGQVTDPGPRSGSFNAEEMAELNKLGY